MAPLDQHNSDCIRFLGEPFDEVNRWIDELFKTHGAKHRRFRHHREGIEEARTIFGDRGAAAAAIHVLRDCRNIPRKSDYDDKTVDDLGLKRYWPVTAYIKYTEESFEALVMSTLFGPTGRILWAFISGINVEQFVAGASKLTVADVQGLKLRFEAAIAKREALEPIAPFQMPEVRIDSSTDTVLKSAGDTQMYKSLLQASPNAHFGFVRLSDLVCPIVLIDQEYVEELRAELRSLEQADIVRFALPETVNIPVKATVDPAMRTVSFVSNYKTLSVTPVAINQVNGGVEVRFAVGANSSPITVSIFQDRLVLRNGIHRAFLLAQRGISDIPCLLVKEDVLPTSLSIAYPAFTPETLVVRRPPLLIDFLDQELALEVPLQRSHKLVRISAEETVIPID